MSMYTVMRHPSTVRMKRALKRNVSLESGLLYLRGLDPSVYRSSKKNQITPTSLFQAPPPPLAPGVSCLFYMVRLCLCVLFKVCKRRCLDKEKKNDGSDAVICLPL